MSKLRTVRLYGELGRKFGRVHQLAVENTAQAVQILRANFKDFEKYLIDSQTKGVTFACFLGKRNINEKELHDQCLAEDIRIAPVLAGSKRGGLFQTIVGVALMVVSYFVPPAYAMAASMLFSAGVSLTLGGVAQMLSPQPKMNVEEDQDQRSNKGFNSVTGVSMGSTIPVCYGECYATSVTVSAGVYSRDTA